MELSITAIIVPNGKAAKDVADFLFTLEDHGNASVVDDGYTFAMIIDCNDIKVGTPDPEE